MTTILSNGLQKAINTPDCQKLLPLIQENAKLLGQNVYPLQINNHLRSKFILMAWVGNQKIRKKDLEALHNVICHIAQPKL